jgi:hypothetical protein
MILVNFAIQDGENQYRDWDYDIDFSKADYDNGKVKDFDLLQDMYSVDEDDFDGNNSYWVSDRLVCVESVQDIDQETLDILRRYV